MKLSGTHVLKASPKRIWPHIFNPALLMKLIPGCQNLERVSPNEYRGQVQVGLAAIVGTWHTMVRLVEYDEPRYCAFQGEVSGRSGTISGSASFTLQPMDDGTTLIAYQAEAMISGILGQLGSRFVLGVAQNYIKQGLTKLDEELQSQSLGGSMRIIDLSVPIGEDTLSPPSVNVRLKLTSSHRGPGFWQASKVEMVLHTGSHVDFLRHVQQDGETAADVSLERVCGEALVVDLSWVEANHGISVADLEAHAPDIRPGDIVLVRTDWTEKQWGNFPTYYLESPYCTPEAAQWLVNKGAKAIGFDCFSEYCARLPDFTSEEFIIHKIILENGAILMQQMTNLSQLPTSGRFKFFAPFLKIRGAEGAPVRFFALLD